MVTLGERIKQRREELKMSQGEVARRAGILRQTVGFIEQNLRSDPGSTNLQKIAIVLEMDPDELFKLANIPVIEKPGKTELIKEAEDLEKRFHDFINKLRQS